jgi:hypothetical protein
MSALDRLTQLTQSTFDLVAGLETKIESQALAEQPVEDDPRAKELESHPDWGRREKRKLATLSHFWARMQNVHMKCSKDRAKLEKILKEYHDMLG